MATRLDVGPAAIRASAAILSDEERERASRFRFDRDRRRFVVARARLRQLLGERLGVPPASIELVYGPQGKPALARQFADSELQFNVSHCEDVAAYALARRREVGIDVEAVRVLPDAEAVAARLFSPMERETYDALAPGDKPLGFFNCWTRKEAFIKALGDGLSHPLDRFEVSLAPGEPARIVRVQGAAGHQCGWTLSSFVPGRGMIGAIVVQQVAQ